jgi:hypothetical protein
MGDEVKERKGINRKFMGKGKEEREEEKERKGREMKIGGKGKRR